MAIKPIHYAVVSDVTRTNRNLVGRLVINITGKYILMSLIDKGLVEIGRVSKYRGLLMK